MTSHTVTYSTELMQNYLQAEILSPQAKFEALQTSQGTSLLFSIGTDQVFYVTREVAGDRAGWIRSDLSTGQIEQDFAGATGVVCRDFTSAECPTAAGSSVHLGMVLGDGQHDHLYLSLANSDSDLSWTAQPVWVGYPFDDPDHPLPQLKVVGVMISEASDGEYIVVDVLRDPTSSENLVLRYYIDVNKSGGYAWHPHDVAVDLAAGSYRSSLGRRVNQPIDGLYTSGQVDGQTQFTYQPLYNPYNPNVPASPDILQLPGNLHPDSIAVCRNPDNSSDLYATANGTLYHFSSAGQANNATATALLQNEMFAGVRDLFAAIDDQQVTVWGLNGSDEVFYTSCPLDQLGNSTSWSVPMPILTGVEQLSPYLDRANSANTFFAHTGASTLVKAVKSPGATLWTFRTITLPPPVATTPAQSYSSYTTRIQVLDANSQPVPGLQVAISASCVSSVYLNYLYYVLGPTPVQAETDALGVITIVEAVDTLAGSRLYVSVDGQTTTINPMEKVFSKAASLDSPDLLSTATIKAPDGTTRPLIAPGTDPGLLQQVADGNKQLAAAYAAVANRPAPAGQVSGMVGAEPLSRGLTSFVLTTPVGDLSSILVDAGDLFERLKHDVDHVIQVVEDTATGVWNFIVTLAGEAYHCVLDCVEKVVAAVQWLYTMVKTAVEDLIKYLEFLFEWADFTRTKKVIENIVRTFLDYQVDQIEVVKSELDTMITSVEGTINAWAGTSSWDGLGADGDRTPNSTSTPTAGQSAPGSLLAHHYQNNAQSATQVRPAPVPQPSPNPVEVLLEALAQEADTISETISRLQDLATDFNSMTLTESLKALVAVVADLGLETARHVIDALLDVLYDVAKDAVALLDTPIHIPVISDILSDLGIAEFSFLEVACWIAAIPVTLIYKAAEGAAPFPDDPDTTFLINAADFPTLLQAFSKPSAAAHNLEVAAAAPNGLARDAGASGPLSLSAGTAQAVHVSGHAVSGFCSLVSAILSSFEAAEEDATNPWSIPAAVAGILGGVSGGVASVLAPHDPVENTEVIWVGRVTLGFRILAMLLFSGPAQDTFKDNLSLKVFSVSDGRGVGAIVDSVLVLPALAYSCWHFYELSQKPVGADRSIAIVDETSSLTAYISRISYAVAVNTEEIPKAVAIGVMATANVVTGGLQIAESMIH
ncbi:hypothetical protein GCM10009841_22640 [Microlunatus panaciterrae]|uniref:Uncharacterized protein n=1 Tax=Microlunatus panaciterrae TaxID=400768 RepID=A0ABS2RDY7_9ACTN|nr:hypothetical protein [Microlunatus panaciterrae]MBM7797147.1 hypothetical protein [Microlunatus panaciterrae]